MSNFLTSNEINGIKGLLYYMNNNLSPASGVEIALDIRITDSNGDPCGRIGYNDAGYVFYLGDHDDC